MSIPNTQHWAIITTKQTYIPGDERSRTNPGHGYPEHYEESINYEVFTDYSKFATRVAHLSSLRAKFTAIQANPVTVETNITIRVGK